MHSGAEPDWYTSHQQYNYEAVHHSQVTSVYITSSTCRPLVLAAHKDEQHKLAAGTSYRAWESDPFHSYYSWCKHCRAKLMLITGRREWENWSLNNNILYYHWLSDECWWMMLNKFVLGTCLTADHLDLHADHLNLVFHRNTGDLRDLYTWSYMLPLRASGFICIYVNSHPKKSILLVFISHHWG